MNGHIIWTNSRVSVSSADNDQANSQIISDENFREIIVWQDFRNGNYDIYSSWVDTSSILDGRTVHVFTNANLTASFNIYQNYPNPFNPKTNISYTLPSESQVKLSIYNLLGELIETIVNEKQDAGKYDAVWNAGNYPSGVSIYTLEAVSVNGDKQTKISKKMILLR